MHISEFKTSKYLTKGDVQRPITATVESVAAENVAPEGQKPELKAVIRFEEDIKALVQGSQGLSLIAKALGSENTDNWIGKRLTVYVEENISYGGKLVGGIRCRAPKARVINPDADDE